MHDHVTLRNEAGFSLAEILVTIVIVGVCFAAVLGGLFTSIASSAYQRKQATADTLVRDAAELVKNNGTDNQTNKYQSCAGTTTYSLSGLVVPSGFSPPLITAVEYWDASQPGSLPDGSDFHVDGKFQLSCPKNPDYGLQRITIHVTSTDQQVNEVVQVIKRSIA